MDRLMIVEDDFINGIYALMAFDEMNEVEIGDIHATVSGALKMVDEFQPTLVLLDINLKDGLSSEVAKKLGEKNIPYIYVTAVGDLSHKRIDAIEIQNKEFKTIESFQSLDKDPEIWQKAFEIIREERK